jgi:hypothetical protein
MSQQSFEDSTTPEPHVLEGGNALGTPPPLEPARPLDQRPDGIDPVIVRPEENKVATIPEFKNAARVLFVNGINSDEVRSRAEAAAYANSIGRSVELVHVETRGMVADVETARTEMIDQRLAFEGKAEQAIAHEVLSLATSGKDIHIMAYSRGALVTERGLELAQKELEGRGFSADYIAKNVFSHVTLETVNGASHNVPDGVRAVHYVREGDVLVGQPLGMGPLAPAFRAAAVGEMATQGDFRGIAAEMRDGFTNHPNGPIIEVPPLPELNPIAQHLFEQMLPAMKPFEAARADYERDERSRQSADRAAEAVHPDPRPMAPPSLSDVQAGIDRLRANGVNLPNARSVELWHGEPSYGSFVDLGSDMVAQHNGRGAYSVMDVQRDLGGVSPPIGQCAQLSADGQVQVAQIQPRTLELG